MLSEKAAMATTIFLGRFPISHLLFPFQKETTAVPACRQHRSSKGILFRSFQCVKCPLTVVACTKSDLVTKYMQIDLKIKGNFKKAGTV